MIGDGIEVRVLRIGREGVRLGVTAPPSVPVHRREVYDLIREENRRAAGAAPSDRAPAAIGCAGPPRPPCPPRSRMRLEDWREWPAERLAPAVRAAGQRAGGASSAGTRIALFDMIVAERARAGSCRDSWRSTSDGGIAGWCYANLQDGLLFIGALHGQRAEVVRSLLDDDARGGRGGLRARLPLLHVSRHARRGRRAVSTPVRPGTVPVPVPAAARARGVRPPLGLAADGRSRICQRPRVCWRAPTPEPATSRCFAPGARLDEWAAYVVQLVRTPACGELDRRGQPRVSRGGPGRRPPRRRSSPRACRRRRRTWPRSPWTRRGAGAAWPRRSSTRQRPCAGAAGARESDPARRGAPTSRRAAVRAPRVHAERRRSSSPSGPASRAYAPARDPGHEIPRRATASTRAASPEHHYPRRSMSPERDSGGARALRYAASVASAAPASATSRGGWTRPARGVPGSAVVAVNA